MKNSPIRSFELRSLAIAFASMTALTLAVIPTAHARGTGGILGNPYLGAKSTCFNEYFGGVTNTCPTPEQWAVMAVMDGGGQKTFWIRAKGKAGTANKVSCRAYATDGNGAANWSSLVETTQFTGAVELLVASVFVPGWGSQHAFCTMDSETTILSMHYDP